MLARNVFVVSGKLTKSILTLSLVTFILGSVINWASDDKDNGNEPQEAPNFVLKDLSGNSINSNDYRGRLIILDFWSPNCPPCLEEMRHFTELYDRYKKKDFEVVGIVLYETRIKKIKNFIEENKINYQILLSSRKIVKDYRIAGTPTTFIINREGKIVKEFIGYQGKAVFEENILTLLVKDLKLSDFKNSGVLE